MSFGVEGKKLTRIGFYTVFFIGACFASVIPVLYMISKSEHITGMEESPLRIILQSNWQVIAMINVVMILIGACIAYHIEYADGGLKKLSALPVSRIGLFLTKFVLLTVMMAGVIALEIGSITACAIHWFSYYQEIWSEAAKNYIFILVFCMPVILLSLIISELFENMWISLGIGVTGVFFGTMVITKGFNWAYIPYVMPYYTFATLNQGQEYLLLSGALIELLILSLIQLAIIKLRSFLYNSNIGIPRKKVENKNTSE